MVDKLRLEVLLAAVDKVSGPLQKIVTGSKATSKALGETEFALKKLEKQQRQLSRYQDETAKLNAARDKLTAAQAQGEKEGKLKKLTGDYEKQASVLKKLRAEMQMSVVGDVSMRQQKLAASIATTNASIDAQRAKLERQRQVEQRLAALREKHGADMTRLGMHGAAAAGAMYGGRRVVQASLAPVGSFMQHEDAMLGVLRQVEGARGADGKPTEVYRKVEAQIRELSGRLPQTTTQITDMVTAAARMEVPTAELAKFVEMASEMGTAFDTTPDEIAESMGKIAKNLKIPVTEIRAMADTINYLDDNAISKGADIIGALNRVSGITGTVGINGQNMAALVSTLLTSGETEETTGTGIKAIFTKFASATRGDKSFQRGLGSIGVDAKKLQTGMSKDAVGTLLAVVERIKKLPASERMGVMADLVDVHHVGRLAKLVSNTEEFRRQLQLVNGEEAKGSMAREAAVRNTALRSQLQQAQNRLFNASVVLGQQLKQTIIDLLAVVNPLVESFTGWVQENPQLAGGILKAVVLVGALTAAAGGLGVAVVSVLAPLMIARFVLGKWILGLAAAKVGAVGAAGALLAIRRGAVWLFRLLTKNPIASFVVGIAVALQSISEKWDTMVQAWNDGDMHTIGISLLQGFVDGVDAMFLGLPSAIAKILTGIYEVVTGIGWDISKALAAAIWGTLEAVLDSMTARLYSRVKGWLGKGWDAITGSGDDANQPGPPGKTVRTAAVAAAMAAAVPLAGASTTPLDAYQPVMIAAPAPKGAPTIATTNQITIHAAPGMDEKALARAVTFEMDRRERAQASRRYSRLDDID